MSTIIERLTAEDKAALGKVAKLLQEAQAAWNEIDGGKQCELNAVHNEEGQLAHCLRWGYQAADDLLKLAGAEIQPEPKATVQTSVDIKHWGAYHVDGTVDTHRFEIADQRKDDGQVYATISGMNDNPDEMISVTMEVNTHPNGMDHVPCVHVHFNNDSLAVSLFKIGERILVRPECNVGINACTQKVYGIDEQMYWIE